MDKPLSVLFARQELNWGLSFLSENPQKKINRGELESIALNFYGTAVDESMPEISRFYGIVIRMNCGDHNPPHFHAFYQDFHGVFSIRDLKLIGGKLPKRVKVMIIEWAFEHRLKLLKNWELASAYETPNRIAPLK